MSQIRLVLADLDQMFLEKFSAYLQKNKSTHFHLELFTSPLKLINWLNMGGKADLLAISSTFLYEMEHQPENKNIVILIDSPQSQLPQGYVTIHKYKPAEMLMKEILSHCADNLPQDNYKKEISGHIHLILYADGSDVLNPVAQAMASIFSKNHQPTFYLSLDELSNTDSYFSGNNTRGLSEMLYYVKSQKENLSLKAEACSSKDIEFGVEFMNGHQNSEDIGKLSSIECESLLQAIRSRACYSEIVLSREFREDALLPLLLKEAQKIYVTALNYPTSHNRLLKIDTFLSNFEEHNGLDLKSKVLILLTLLNKGNSHLNFDIPHYQKAYLPLPYEGGDSFFPPSEEYQLALQNILAR